MGEGGERCLIMTFNEKLRSDKFLVTSEIGPPKGIDVREALEDADLLKGRVDAINVTDIQSSVMRLGSLAVCRLLKERGHEPIYQLTCRDRNRLALQSDLLSAAVLGIENVLLLTGDYTTLGDHPQAKPVFDIGSVQLIRVAKTLMEGKDMVGSELKGTPSFCIGAVVNPGADPLEPEIMKMAKKIKAGAQFFQTQAVYDVEQFKRFLEMAKGLDTVIMAGIVLLKSAGMAKFMNKNVSGVSVPDNLIKEMEETKNKSETSIEIAARLITELKPLCRGVHIMPLGWDKKVPAILEKVGL
ncbi:MAG: methylenetetrahydrofolate reductase [Candidatus Omnitrophota bacterium]